MRNLCLLGTKNISFSGRVSSDTVVSAVALDLDEDSLYVATEHDTEDTDVVLEVWKIQGYSQQDDGYDPDSVSAHIMRARKSS